MAMQALQPRIKEIQERYKGKPQDEMQVRCACARTMCSAAAVCSSQRLSLALASEPGAMAQVEVARLYKDAGVNPLAGCLPTLVTLPVWIGLYRALSNVADEGLLTEGFFWIPSLAGPTSLAAQKAVRGP